MQNTSNPAALHSMLKQHRLSLLVKSLVVTLSVVAFYFQDLSMVFNGALNDEASFHILVIPFLFVYLIYRKRRMVNAAITQPTLSRQFFQRNFSLLAGVTLCAVAILTYWYGSYTFTPLEYHMFTLPVMTAGLVLILFNPQTLKQLFFPIAFLIFLCPPPSEILYGLGSELANLSALASNALANLFGIAATLTSTNVGPVITIIRPDATPLSFNVSVACSGIYSLIGFVIFAVFIAYITYGKFRNKSLVMIIGVPMIILLNIIRITVILAIGYHFGEELALQFFHTIGATVLMFIGTLILLVISEKVFKKPAQPKPCTKCTSTLNPLEHFCSACGKLLQTTKTKLNKIDVAKIAGIIAVIALLLSIQAPVFALTQGPAEVIIQTPTGTQVTTDTAMFPKMSGYNLTYLYRDTAFEQTTGNDAALAYLYSPANQTDSLVWVAIQIGSSSTSQHRWETCLVNYPLSQGDPSTVTQLDLKDIQLQDNPPVTARYFAFQYRNTNQTQAVIYWYQSATFSVNGTSQTKSVMISVIMYPRQTQDLAPTENTLIEFAEAINNYWQPIKTWSVITLAISENGLALSTAAAAVLVFLVLYALYLDRQEKQSLLTLYKKLPAQDQLLLKAVKNTETASTNQVTEELQKLTGTSVSEEAVSQKLEEAQKAGLIKKALINSRDTPIIQWQSQLPKTSPTKK